MGMDPLLPHVAAWPDSCLAALQPPVPQLLRSKFMEVDHLLRVREARESLRALRNSRPGCRGCHHTAPCLAPPCGAEFPSATFWHLAALDQALSIG